MHNSTSIPRYILLLFSLLVAYTSACAQEINATVQVDRSRINNTSLTYLDNFAGEIESYINDYAWSNDSFQSHEQINVMMQINLTGFSDNFTFNANVVIRAMRPIYNSTRQTTVFLYNDENWTFNYTPNRGFIHDELQFDAISTFLDFYAYIILGFDYDSFSALGGSSHFSEAQNLVSQAQTSSSTGWQRSAAVPRNRAQLTADLLNPNYEPLRQAWYVYHRKGLDLFLEQPNEAHSNIVEALEMIQNAKRQTTSNLLFDAFFNAKYREITSIFSNADTNLRLKAYTILSEIDPAHLNEYSKLQ